MKRQALFILSLFFYSASAWPHGEGGTARIGANFALQAVKEGVGFQLSPEAVQFMGIQLSPPWASGHKISSTAWVASLESLVVYVLRDGWIQRIEMGSLARKTGIPPFGHLRLGDQIVVSGVAAVRGADLEISGGEDHHDDEHGEHEDADEGHPANDGGHS